MASLIIKAYMEGDESGRPEIRRFVVDEDISFAYIHSKVAHHFPGMQMTPFTMYWKDPEGEFVTFSSDNELFEALAQLREDIFRIYVKKNNVFEEKFHHPGIICDACDGNIFGLRFKCILCPDYDLCENCESKGHHSEHDMIRMYKPRQDFMGFPSQGSQYEDQGMSPPFDVNQNDPPCDFAFLPQFGNFMHEFMQKIWKPQQQENKENGEKSKTNPQNESFDEQRMKFEQCLLTVGKAVSDLLDPMEIQVDVSLKQNRNEKSQESMTGDAVQGDVEMQEGRRKAQRTATCFDQSTHTTRPFQGSNSTADLDNPDQFDKYASKEKTDGDWTFIHEKNTSIPVDEPSLKQTKSSSSSSGVGHNEGSSGQRSDTEALSDSINQALDPRLSPLLAQMTEMGFNNEGSWLSQLLLANQGDICKVLDALQAVNHHKTF